MLVPFFLDLAERRRQRPGLRARRGALPCVVGASVAVACAESRQVDLNLRQGFLLTTGSWAIFPPSPACR